MPKATYVGYWTVSKPYVTKGNQMTRYKDIPMSQRMEKVGELLAKGIYIYTQKQKQIEKSSNPCGSKDPSQDSDTSPSDIK